MNIKLSKSDWMRIGVEMGYIKRANAGKSSLRKSLEDLRSVSAGLMYQANDIIEKEDRGSTVFVNPMMVETRIVSMISMMEELSRFMAESEEDAERPTGAENRS